MSDQYPPDEFDEIAKGGGPVGVHRAPRPWWSRLVAPVVVFLIAGAAAFFVAYYLWNQDSAGSGDPTPTVSDTFQDTVTPTPSDSPSRSVSPSPSTSSSSSVQYDLKVEVLNGSGISGLAAKSQKVLQSGGFTNVIAGNLTGTKPAANVVVYASEDLKATAAEIAKQLGITTIALDVPQTPARLEVHLVTDPAK